MSCTSRLLTCIAAAAALSGLAACGSSQGSASSSSSGSSAGGQLKVGLVADVAGLNDRSFNSLADQGLQQAQSQLGVRGRVLTSKSNADYVPNLVALAQQHYDLVIGVGFLMADAVDTVAKNFPQTKFAIVDVDAKTLKGAPKNVEGLLFKEQESGYLAGYLAGLYAKDHHVATISSVGGQKIPPVDHYIAGYQAGAKAADPKIQTLNGYSQDFVDQAKCKELALNQIQQGSRVVFQVAAQCGLGALDAAKEKGAEGIGVDADQAYLGPDILTSAVKKVDSAVFDTIKQVRDGKYAGGADATFSVENGGAGIGRLSAGAAKYRSLLDAVKHKLASGAIQPPDTVK